MSEVLWTVPLVRRLAASSLDWGTLFQRRKPYINQWLLWHIVLRARSREAFRLVYELPTQLPQSTNYRQTA